MPDSIVNGLIVERGSPLVQFEITALPGYPEGYEDRVRSEGKLPTVVWVDRRGRDRDTFQGSTLSRHQCKSLVFDAPFMKSMTPGRTPVVCLCMGRFIE